MRPLCACGQRPVAINYYKKGKPFYRSKCESCTRHGRPHHGMPKWQQAGYTMKNNCDKCGFKSRHKEQFSVYYIDGNLNNVRFSNLKTVCSNCSKILYKEGIKWKQGDLVPDL